MRLALVAVVACGCWSTARYDIDDGALRALATKPAAERTQLALEATRVDGSAAFLRGEAGFTVENPAAKPGRWRTVVTARNAYNIAALSMLVGTAAKTVAGALVLAYLPQPGDCGVSDFAQFFAGVSLLASAGVTLLATWVLAALGANDTPQEIGPRERALVYRRQ